MANSSKTGSWNGLNRELERVRARYLALLPPDKLKELGEVERAEVDRFMRERNRRFEPYIRNERRQS